MPVDQTASKVGSENGAAGPTDIIYVCTPDREDPLFASIHSLLRSQTKFDHLIIYCIGSRPQRWNFTDRRIEVVEAEPVIDGYFFSNKSYLCGRDASRVLYLDADTLVLKPLHQIWESSSADFLGRPTTGYTLPHWNQPGWQHALEKVGAEQVIPYFNAGFFILQNQGHQRICKYWLDFMEQDRQQKQVRGQNDFFSEQRALTLSVAAANLSVQSLTEKEHAYGWEQDSYEDTFLFHTGGMRWPVWASIIERSYSLDEIWLPFFKEKVPSLALKRWLRFLKADGKRFLKQTFVYQLYKRPQD